MVEFLCQLSVWQRLFSPVLNPLPKVMNIFIIQSYIINLFLKTFFHNILSKIHTFLNNGVLRLWLFFMDWFSLFDITNYDFCICIDLLSECTFQIDINNISHDNDYDSDASTIPYAESDVRMHCKMVFNFTIRHDHAFKSCQTRWPFTGLRHLILIGFCQLWWSIGLFC